MDALALMLTAPCAEVTRVSVTRVVDAKTRRLPLQRKVGAGLNLNQFRRANEFGFDWVTLAEHHYSAFSLSPNPMVMAGVLSQIVRRAYNTGRAIGAERPEAVHRARILREARSACRKPGRAAWLFPRLGFCDSNNT